MKKGLVLEGGAMRGLFSAGVMDVLMERGVAFDGIIGVSAGAAFGCNYKSGQIGRVLRYNTRFCGDKRYSGMGSLLKTGNLFNTEFCYNQVPLELDPFDFEAFRSNPAEFYVVCTDVNTGEPAYHAYTGFEDHGFEWIRASASLPLIAQIVEIDGQKLLDGGIADSIPFGYFESIGYDRNVVVLTRPLGYRKEKNRLLPLLRKKYRQYPALVQALEDRHERYNRELEELAAKEERGLVFVLRPDRPLPVRKAEKNPEKLREAYDMGRKAAEQAFERLKDFLEKV